MIKMSVFQEAQRAAERLSRVRALRTHCQGGGEVECQWGRSYLARTIPGSFTLTEASREHFIRALDAEEQALLAEIAGYGVDLDEGAA
jgi:hypothetical protein